MTFDEFWKKLEDHWNRVHVRSEDVGDKAIARIAWDTALSHGRPNGVQEEDRPTPGQGPAVPDGPETTGSEPGQSIGPYSGSQAGPGPNG